MSTNENEMKQHMNTNQTGKKKYKNMAPQRRRSGPMVTTAAAEHLITQSPPRRSPRADVSDQSRRPPRPAATAISQPSPTAGHRGPRGDSGSVLGQLRRQRPAGCGDTPCPPRVGDRGDARRTRAGGEPPAHHCAA